jgi:hypothetical protein
MEDIEDSEEEWGECVELDVRCPELASHHSFTDSFLKINFMFEEFSSGDYRLR